MRRPSVVGVQPGGGSRAAHGAYSLPVHLTIGYKGGILIFEFNFNSNNINFDLNINKFRLPSPNLYSLVAQRLSVSVCGVKECRDLIN